MDGKFCTKCGTKLLTPGSNCYNCGQSIIPKSKNRNVFLIIIVVISIISLYLAYKDSVGISQNDSSASVISIEEPKRLDFEKKPDINTLVNKTPTPTSTPIPYTLISIAVNANLLPDKTFAGSDICNDGIEVAVICVELLEYSGFDPTYKADIITGIEETVSRYSLTKEDVTVDWDIFGPDGGMINYLGIVLFNADTPSFVLPDPPQHGELTFKDSSHTSEMLISDVCEFTYVNLSLFYCKTEILESLNFLIETKNPGYYMDIRTDLDNGHLVVINQSQLGFQNIQNIQNIGSDDEYSVEARNLIRQKSHIEISSHEYFHMYQTVHSEISPIYDLESFDKMASTGPIWLNEGTAELASYYITDDILTTMYPQMKKNDLLEEEIIRMIQNVDNLLKNNQDIKKYKISENITYNDYVELIADNDMVYDMYTLASIYAAVLSSHDAVMIDYWDDLKKYGPEASFYKNIGMPFDDFYIKFDEFLYGKNTYEQLETLLSADFIDSTPSMNVSMDIDDCLGLDGFLVKCDSQRDLFKITNIITIQGDYLPSDEDLELLNSENCDFNSVFMPPTKETWAFGDRIFLCVSKLNDEKIPYTQTYYKSPVYKDDCLNEYGQGVECYSKYALYVVTKAIQIKSNTLPTDFSRYSENCPDTADFTFRPTKETWAFGDRNFLCVIEK